MDLKLILKIIFYVFGIGLPILIVVLEIFKKRENKLGSILSKCLISVIIFLIFYIVKVGGIKLIDDINTDNIPTMEEVDETHINTSTTTTEKIEETSDFKVEIIDGVTYIDGVLIANKSYPLPSNFVPKDTYKDPTGIKYCTDCINVDAFNSFEQMKSDALALGLNIWIQSGYRSYSAQEELYNSYVNRDGKIAADTYSARPGHSEHQTGLAFDLNSITDDFQYTNEGIWVNENAYRYGFILRYPKGKEDITGYKYESWHLRYVGVELATKLYNNGDWITLEEYFQIKSTYN